MSDDAEPPRSLAERLAELLMEMAAVWTPAALDPRAPVDQRPAPDGDPEP